MLDSIHLARWIGQFSEQNIEFLLFPSKNFRKLHPAIFDLINSQGKAKYQMAIFARIPLRFTGYVDYILSTLLPIFIKLNFRVALAEKIIKMNNFSFIHALEIQGAGYLLENLDERVLSQKKIIVTNWGSDIYYFRNFPEHISKITKILNIATHYSAECQRDYDLAREYGFRGIELPCIPNAGGFHLDHLGSIATKANMRNQVIIKGYGGEFGRIDLPLEISGTILEKYPATNIFFYSVTKDAKDAVKRLATDFPDRVTFSTVDRPLKHEELISQFVKSRVYIGCSSSDGVSTSFLEALINGAYPIQTSTSCANDWVEKGAVASIIPLNSDILFQELDLALLFFTQGCEKCADNNADKPCNGGN